MTETEHPLGVLLLHTPKESDPRSLYQSISLEGETAALPSNRVGDRPRRSGHLYRLLDPSSSIREEIHV
jgi:hypothetical protein